MTFVHDVSATMNARLHGPEEAQADLVDLFLEEMKSRRERLAHWVQLLQDEFGEDMGGAARRRRRCRTKAVRPAPARKS